jgi:succinyl-diaminopimelate desuccinylase
MKGSIAAFVAAVAHVPADAGTISLIITGDEEGPATYGTLAIIDHMKETGDIPDLCIVGEPTSVHRLGDMIKVGRRGSVNIWLEVAGVQGHVAYPHLADNPLTKLVALLAELKGHVLDEGTDWFQASNLEITDVSCGNPATNVIPPRASARVSIRFNDLHTGQSLADWVRGRRPPWRHRPRGDLGRGVPDAAGRFRSWSSRRSAPKPAWSRKFPPAAARRMRVS